MNIVSGIKLDNERFPALTGVRAVAAFMVFFHHLRLNLKPDWLVGLERTFYWGVTLFFVLSGFLITYRYFEKVTLSGRWLMTYFINRFARIYPVYFVILTVVIVLSKNTHPIFLLQNYTLTHSLFFLFKSHGLAIDPSWSLTAEECFYLLAPFIFLLCKKYNFWIPFLLNLVLGAAVLLTHGDGLSLQHTIFPIMFGTFFGHFTEFYAGIWLALIILKKEQQAVAGNGLRNAKWTMAGIVGMAILMIPLIHATKMDTDTKELIMILVNNILLPVPIVLFFYGLVRENSLCRRILSGGPMRLLGRSSYAFYLLHLPLIDYLGKPLIRKYFGDAHYNLYVLAVFLITLVLSVLLYLFFEDPANRFIRRKLTPVFAGRNLTPILTGGVLLLVMGILSPAPVRAQFVAVYVSSAGGDRLTKKADGKFIPARVAGAKKQPKGSSVSPIIRVDEDTRYQKIDGFGATFNEAGMICLGALNPGARDEVLKNLFDTLSGAGFTLMKSPMAACDFASAGPWYSYDDTEGDTAMQHFSIRRDLGPFGQVNYIRNAARFGHFHIETTMDFAPDWMMYGLKNGQKHVRPEYYGALSKYYSLFLRAYAAEGIRIDYLNPFNEAENDWYSNTTYREIGEMIKNYIAPRLRADGLSVKIQLCEAASRPEAVRKFPVVLDDPAAGKEISGLTVHGYDWNGFSSLTDLHSRYPDLPIWMTEVCYALPNNIPSGGPRKLPVYDFEDGAFWGNMIMNDLKHEVSGWIYWNMILDQDGGPWLVSGEHGDPDHNHQQPVVIVNRTTGKVSYTGLYYYLAHFSRFIRPGSYRIGCSVSRAPAPNSGTSSQNPDSPSSAASSDLSNLNVAAFLNADSSRVLNIINTGTTRDCRFLWKNRVCLQRLPAHSITTLKW